MNFKKIEHEECNCYINPKEYNIKRKILLVGDSHSFRYLSAIKPITKCYGYTIYYKYVRTPYIIYYISDYLEDLSDNFDVIIQYNSLYATTSKIHKKYHKGINKFLRYLSKYTKQLIYFRPTPFVYKKIPCKKQLNKILYNGTDILIPPIFEIEKIKGLEIANLSYYFCNNVKYCYGNYGNKCIYSDENHLTYEFLSSISYNISIHLLKYLKPLKRKVNINTTAILYKNKFFRYWIPPPNCKVIFLPKLGYLNQTLVHKEYD